MKQQSQLDRKEIMQLPSKIAMKYFKLFRVTMAQRAKVKPYLYHVLYSEAFAQYTKEQIIDKTVELMKEAKV